MGNVKSFCCKDNVSEIDDREERSRILDNQCDAPCDDFYRHIDGSPRNNSDTVSYGSINNVNGCRSVEQSALDRIYQKMASNVIDVAPGEPMSIQQAEFVERRKAYQSRLNQIKTPFPFTLKHRNPKHVASGSLIDVSINHTSPPSHLFNHSTRQPADQDTTHYLHMANHDPIGFNNHSPHNSKSHEKRRVEYEPISANDIELISEISRKSTQAIRNFKVQSSEEIIAYFKP